MNALLAILGIIAAAFVVSLAIYGGVCLLSKLESFVAAKFFEQAHGYRPDTFGDLVALPDEAKAIPTECVGVSFHDGREA